MKKRNIAAIFAAALLIASCSPGEIEPEEEIGLDITASNYACSHLVKNVPEIGTFARYLDEVSGGKVSLLLQARPFPDEIPNDELGTDYFLFYAGENQPDCIVDWKWFAVSNDYSEILCFEADSGEFEALEQWRNGGGYPRYLDGRLASGDADRITSSTYKIQHEADSSEYIVTVISNSASGSTLLLFESRFKKLQSIDLGAVPEEVSLVDINEDGYMDILIEMDGIEGEQREMYFWNDVSRNLKKATAAEIDELYAGIDENS
ncbi:MAG: hypothetical protein FWG42_04170 [Clostridiales bacterium]|nr:hypothetical protein [Clostridiales bacterium]